MPDVFTNGLHAGVIERRENTLLSRFTYGSDADAQRIISLTMPPVPNGVFDMDKKNMVHPAFAMNLPEGRLREGIDLMFHKKVRAMDDLFLLEIVGHSQIGRVRVAPTLADLDAVPEMPVDGLLKANDNPNLFAELLEQYARYAGVSGAQPKILVRDNDSLNPKIAVRSTTHIIKFFDRKEHPALASNEYICLLAAKAAGIPVSNVWLSEDRQRLVVERFDILPNGGYLAFEDCCSLVGYQPRLKYTGSYEQVAQTLSGAIAPAHVRADMANFFRSLVLSVIVRNSDAHRKNFGVLYNTVGDVRLSPAFDIVTTTAYEKLFPLALTMNSTKSWPDAKELSSFALNYCNMTQREAKEAIAQVAEAVAQTRPEITKLLESSPDAATANISKAMILSWEAGLKGVGLKTETKAIQ